MNLQESPVTLLMLIINTMVSIYGLFVDPRLIDKLALRPVNIIRDGEWGRVISGAFVHAGVGHLAFNMLTLFFFGPILERVLGSGRYLILYAVSLVAAHLLTLYRHRKNASYSAVGASGAISGVLFAFCLYFPWERIYIFLIPIGIPAVLFAVGYIIVSVYAMQGGRSGIAHEAHLGGAIGGLLITLLLDPSALGIFLSQIGL